ncbi:MAG: dihydroneopterin aldolase [Candidatus Muiribacteriota bacterium]
MSTLYKLRLNEMVFYGYHGVGDAERKVGQRFVVSLEMEADLNNAAISDSLNDTINYEEIFINIKKLVQHTKFFLIESLAKKIADYVLANHKIVQKIKVCVKKPQVPIPEMTGYSEIEIIKEQE